MTITPSTHLVASPGAILEGWLDERGMSQRELADRTSRSEKFISQLVNGKASLTADTAHALELVSGVGASTWLKIEAEYRASLKHAQAISAADAADSPVDAALVKFLRAHGVVTAARGARGEQTLHVFRFLGVASADGLAHLTRRHAAAFRTSTAFTPDAIAIEVVIALAHAQAQLLPTAPFDVASLRASIPRLRALTCESPSDGARAARTLLAQAGVALVFLPNIPKAHCNGVTLWEGNRALVAVTDRCQKEDIFWFTLFHEISHVLDGDRDAIYLEGNAAADDKPPAEARADRFATDTLIPPDQEHLLSTIRRLDDLSRVAGTLGVSPGVIVGQLHHRGLKPYSWGNAYVRRVTVEGR